MAGDSVTWTAAQMLAWLDALVVSRGAVAPTTELGRAPHGASVPILNGIATAYRDGLDREACFTWPYGRDRDGYGIVRVGRVGRMRTHRYIYGSVVGPILGEVVLDHLCRNRACLNPFHLEPVTHAENIRRGDGFAPRNAAKTHCKRGHPFDELNTRIRKTGRACRTCERDRNHARRSTIHSRASVTRAL